MRRPMSIVNSGYVERAEKLREFIVELTLSLCRERTVNYSPNDFPGDGPDGMPVPGMESRITAILGSHLETWGIGHEIHAKTRGRDNLLASVGRGDPSYRTLFLPLHTDTLPAGDLNAWSFDPYSPFEQDGRLYGRGVLDNKGPLASAFAAIKLLKEDEAEIPGKIVFGAVADEEVGAGNGIEFLLEKGLIDATDAIVPDVAGEMREINVAEKGRLVLKGHFKGKSAHAMHPSKGVNAIYAAARFLRLVEAHRFRFDPHPVFDPPTLTTGLIRGGSAPNHVAAVCEVTRDVRYLPSQSIQGILAELEELARQVKLPGARISFQTVLEWLPSEVSEDAPIVGLIREVAPEARVVGIGGGTLAKPLVHAGIDAVGWGPGNQTSYHGADEEIEVSQLVSFTGRIAALGSAVANCKRPVRAAGREESRR